MIFILLFAISCSSNNSNNEVVANDTQVADTLYEFGIPVNEFEMKEGVVKRGQFFSTLLSDMGVPYADIYALTEASKGIFDLRKIRVGNGYKAFFSMGEEPKLSYLVYEESKTSYVTFCIHDSISVRVAERDIATRLRYASGSITNSLWSDMERSGINPLLAIRLSEIYAWTIDFFGLQKGDSYKILYEETLVDGEVAGIGAVLSSSFIHMGDEIRAYSYTQDESRGYWNQKGENLQKAFLKAPLSYTRISSGFTYSRRHPVTRIVRPHTGVDYAAPRGTPVMSIGDGVVIQKGYAGGGGNTVKIRHNSTYTTAYLHLSKYAKGISKGARVKQGQVIGYVGSTGLSTGPHLDFRVWRNGSPINPLKMESPPAKGISKEEMDSFLNYTQKRNREIDSLISISLLDSMVYNLGKR